MRKKLSMKAWLQFITCALGAFGIMYILFCRARFYDALIEAMSVTNTQFGVLYAVYGWIAVVGYLIGGFIADKVSPRWLMFVSFLGTAICNFVLGLWPSYQVCLVLYAVMGITTTVTFWDTMLKCNRIFGRSIGDENRAFSWLQTVRGLGEMIISTFIVFLFTKFVDMVAGLRFVIWFYAGFLLLFAVISLFVFDDEVEEDEKEESTGETILSTESTLKQTIRLLKNPDLLLCVAIAFGGYNIGSCIGSYLGDMAGVFGASVATIAYIGTMNAWLKPLGAFCGSFLVKKKGPTFCLEACTWIYMVILAVFIFLPKEGKYLPIFIALLAVEIILTGLFRSQKFIQIREAGIPMQDTGNAFGIISTIIYSADAFMPTFIGIWLDRMGEEGAYTRLYYILLASGGLTLAASIIFRRRNKTRIQQLLIEDNEAAAGAE